MKRYDAVVEDGVLSLEGDDGALEVGPMDVVVDELGETYTVSYNERQQAAGWLETDEDGEITFDVRETIADLDFDEAFVKQVAGEPLDRETAEGDPQRTVAFAELIAEIWDARGNIHVGDE